MEATLETVEYRDIPGLFGYRAGSDGTIWSCRIRGVKDAVGNVWKKLRPYANRNGYLVHNLPPGRHRFVHSLVLEASR